MSAVLTSPAPEISATADEIFVMPASVSQRRFWMLEQMSPGNTALNIPIALQLIGPLDTEILEHALQALVDRHETLRTRFELVGGEPRQVIAPQAELTLHRVNAAPLPPEQHRERTMEEMDREAERPIDFDHAPLMRATLLELAAEEHVLMLTAHHIISDGWSNGVLVRELGAFYEAFRREEPVALAPLPIQYADYVLWQDEWLKTPEYRQQLDFWRGTLGGELPVLDFPTDFPRQAVQPTEAILESLLLPAALTDALKRFCQEEGVTLFMIFMTAYAALLSRYTGQGRVLIGTTAANRNRPELENLIGLFANLLVVPLEVTPEISFRDLLARQRDQSLASFAHHEAPFELIVQDVQQAGGAKVALQTHFLFQRAFMQPMTCGELQIRPLHSVSPGSTFELTFGIVERAEGIRLQMEYRTSLYRQETVRRLLRHFRGLLESAVAQPETPVAELVIFDADERDQLEQRLQETRPSDVSSEQVIRELDRQVEANLRACGPCFARVEIKGASLLALDGEHRSLAYDVPGEIYLMGDAEAGAADGGENGLPTGFLGRNAEQGVEIWGRVEDIVRVHGFRFNRRAVEVQLRLHPDVKEACVLTTSTKTSPRLTAFVVLENGAHVGKEELRAFLKGKVSDLLIPATVAIVRELPTEAAGVDHDDGHAKPPSLQPGSLQSLLQQQLLEIWERLLKTSDLTIRDNFFEVGGNSFLALRMMLEAEKLTGRHLPLSLLLTGATVTDLAHHILENANHDASTPVIPLQTKGERPPLFFLHGDWVGGGFYSHRLAQHLGGDQPFYALPPFHMKEERIVTMAEMAAYHCAALRQVRPHGPYLIGGYCIGAMVAIEVARLLLLSGERVSHLFLVDPPLWGGMWLRGMWPVVNRVGDAGGWNLEKKIEVFDRTVVPFSRWWRKPLSAKFASVSRRFGLGKRAGGGDETEEEMLEDGGEAAILDGLDFSTYFITYRLHQLTPLSVPATLLLPSSTAAARAAQAGAQSRLAAPEIQLVPGNHTTCITRHTAELAERMRRVIDALPSPGTGPKANS